MTRVTCIRCENPVERIAAVKAIKTFPAKEVKIGRGKMIIQPPYEVEVWICLDCKEESE